MAALPIPTPPRAPAAEATEQRFRRLAAQWQRDTQFLSDTGKIIRHPAFQEIVSLGDAVVPLMLADRNASPALWVWALPDITGEDPVPADDRGNIRKMGEAWVRWGRAKGIIR